MTSLGILQMPSFTAFSGMGVIARLVPDETAVVAAAASASGQLSDRNH